MSELPDFSAHGYTLSSVLTVNPQGGRIAYAGHDRDGRRVFIKRFSFAGFDASWSGFEEQRREIQVLRELDHPRIPNYVDCFTTNDGLSLVQEWLELPSLSERTSFDAAELRSIALSLLDILVYLQQRLPPVIHRDIKPANVLVDAGAQAYLVDFGLARAGVGTASTIAVGTPGFMAPEQLLGRRLTTATDLFGLGATLIALLTGTPAHELGELIDASMRFDLSRLPAGLDPAFVRWLGRMVAPDLDDRFPDARSAQRALEGLEVRSTAAPASKPVSAARPRTPATRPARVGGPPTGLILGILGSVLALGVFCFQKLSVERPKQAPPSFERLFPDEPPQVFVAPDPEREPELEEPPRPEALVCSSKMAVRDKTLPLTEGPAVIAHAGCVLTFDHVTLAGATGVVVERDAHVELIDSTIIGLELGLDVAGSVELVRSRVTASTAARVTAGLLSLDDASTLDGEVSVDEAGEIVGFDLEADAARRREQRLRRYEGTACAGVRACYAKFEGRSRVEIRADIDSDGTVRRVSFKGKRPPKPVADCIVDAQKAAPIPDYEPLDGPGVRTCKVDFMREGFMTQWSSSRSFVLRE